MKNRHLKPEVLFEFDSENLEKEEKHLKGFTIEEKKMIKLMANIFAKQVVKNQNLNLENKILK